MVLMGALGVRGLMPISETGSKKIAKTAFSSGFTLLEIMLVLVIVAITAAIVVPRMFHSSLEQLHDEGRRLQHTLRLAIQESAMTGFPIRLVVYERNYHFEQIHKKGGVWQAMHGAAFKGHAFPQGFWIDNINIEGELPSVSSEKKPKEKLALGQLEIYPDGRLTLADISLAVRGGKEVIRVRPGPGGVSKEFVNATP